MKRGAAWQRLESMALAAAGGLALLAVWHVAVVASRTTVFPSPYAVLRGVRELAGRGVLLPYLRDSLLRVGVGFGLALVTATPLGMSMGRFAALATAVNPVIQLVRPISPLAWTPLAIVFFGVGMSTPIFLIFLGSFCPIVVLAMNAVREVPPIYLRAGRNFGLGTAALLRRVILPACLPRLISGYRLTLGVAWLVVVAAEMIAVDSGLGYLVVDARNAGKRYDLVVAGMLLIGVVGLALDGGMRWIERRRSLRWGFES